jgi:hypothetical protein
MQSNLEIVVALHIVPVSQQKQMEGTGLGVNFCNTMCKLLWGFGRDAKVRQWFRNKM